MMSNSENSKGIHLIWVSGWPYKPVLQKFNIHLVTHWPTVIWSQIDHLVTRGLRIKVKIISRPYVVRFSKFQRRSSRTGHPRWDQVGPRDDQQSFGHKGYNPGIKSFWCPILKIPNSKFGSLDDHTSLFCKRPTVIWSQIDPLVTRGLRIKGLKWRLYLGRTWSDFQNSKGVLLVLVTQVGMHYDQHSFGHTLIIRSKGI